MCVCVYVYCIYVHVYTRVHWLQYAVSITGLFLFDCSPSRAVKVVPISLIPCKYANTLKEARSNRCGK